jgi:hypothetical protein
MKGLDKGGQGPISGCCTIEGEEEEEEDHVCGTNEKVTGAQQSGDIGCGERARSRVY